MTFVHTFRRPRHRPCFFLNNRHLLYHSCAGRTIRPVQISHLSYWPVWVWYRALSGVCVMSKWYDLVFRNTCEGYQPNISQERLSFLLTHRHQKSNYIINIWIYIVFFCFLHSYFAFKQSCLSRCSSRIRRISSMTSGWSWLEWPVRTINSDCT